MLTIHLEDQHLDTVYRALAELPAKFSHPVMSHLEAEVKRIQDEAAKAKETADTARIQQAIEDGIKAAAKPKKD